MASNDKPMTYHLMCNVGTCRYVINYYTGERRNPDGSLAADIALYKNKRKANAFVIGLQRQGYTGNGIF